MLKNILTNFKKLLINKKTKKNADKNMVYTYSRVFYKTKNTPGWFFLYLNGTEETVKIKCEKLKSTKDIYDFKILGKDMLRYKLADFQKTNLNALSAHMISDWIYWKELDKWFILEDEEIPYPETICETSQFFNIHAYFPEDMNEWESFEDEECIYATVEIYLKSNKQKMSSCIKLSNLSQNVENFIQKIKQGKFAKLIIDDYSQHKFLAWNHKNKIRLVVQDYDSDEARIIFDVLVDKEKFLLIFEKTIKYIKRHNDSIIKTIKNGLMS